MVGHFTCSTPSAWLLGTLRFYRVCIGIMEKKLETTIQGLKFLCLHGFLGYSQNYGALLVMDCITAPNI